MKNEYKRIIGGGIGLLLLSTLIIMLNVQVGFTVFENIDYANYFFIFVSCVFIIISTVIITFFLIRTILRRISEIEIDIKNNEEEKNANRENKKR